MSARHDELLAWAKSQIKAPPKAAPKRHAKVPIPAPAAGKPASWLKCRDRGRAGMEAKCWAVRGGAWTCFDLRARGECQHGFQR